VSETELVSLGRGRGRKRWLVDHRGHQLAVLVVDERVVVIDALCPHRGGPLVEGTEGGHLFAVVPVREPAPSLVDRLRAHARAAPKPAPTAPPNQ